MSDLAIRPHHGLCVNFFQGKGYSSGFVRNMYDVIDALNQQRKVTVICSPDLICSACPELSSGCEKAAVYDRKVMEICGFREGEKLSSEEFLKTVREEIILKGRLAEVCTDCRWFYICSKQDRED